MLLSFIIDHCDKYQAVLNWQPENVKLCAALLFCLTPFMWLRFLCSSKKKRIPFYFQKWGFLFSPHVGNNIAVAEHP